ncbi:MAG: hypothetical protein R3E54_12245 [Halioglobus sp.]
MRRSRARVLVPVWARARARVLVPVWVQALEQALEQAARVVWLPPLAVAREGDADNSPR